jgi:hypothetical protein
MRVTNSIKKATATIIGVFGFATSLACGGQLTSGNGGSSGSGGGTAGSGATGGGSGVSGSSGSGARGSGATGGTMGSGGAGNTTGKGAAGGGAGSSASGGAEGAAAEGGSLECSPDGNDAPGATACVFCPDHFWHCPAQLRIVPNCPSLTIGGNCNGSRIETCLACQMDGTGVIINCDPAGLTWTTVGEEQCTP